MPNKNGREQLSNLYQKVLSSGRPVQIKTFHSWFAALLRSAPLATLQQLGLPLNYELLEDDGPAKALVWRRFYTALLAAPDLKKDFESVVQAYGRFQATKALLSALDKRTEFLLADAAGVVDGSVEHFKVRFPEFADFTQPEDAFQSAPTQAQLLAAAKALGASSAPSFSAKGSELESAVTDRNASAVLAALLTEKGTPRKFSEKIVGLAAVRQAQDEVLCIAAAMAQHSAWDYQQRMARLSRLLLAEFAALKIERGWVDMNDVERAARVMLSDSVLSGWVQERLDARIRHLMIDEFQDTNPLQWQALSSWLSGYGGAGAGGNPPSVFIVGDPKQSIYRFRRAEPQVFIAAQQFVKEALSGDLLACDHTRRSSPQVINCVNAVMGAATSNDGYEGFRPHTTAANSQGRVLRLPPIEREPGETREKSQALESPSWRDSLTTPRALPEETLRTAEARQAAAWIKTVLAPPLTKGAQVFVPHVTEAALGLKPQEVMVLSRKRASLLPLLDELRALSIPAQIGEKTELIDCCEVLDVVALLDVLISPLHDLSMARALRSPLFSLSDDAMVSIVLAKKNPQQSWFDVLLNNELVAPELIELKATLTQFKGWIDALPPHDALQAIYSKGDVLARFAAAAPPAERETVLSNLRAVLGAALQVGGGRYATPYAFVRALKAGGLKAPAAVNPDAVRLLTIHGAKGLEADTVLLLDTDTAPRNADSMSVLIDWPGHAPAPQKFVFLVSESKPPTCALDVLAAEQAARQREELNALYVALTRAKNTLVVSSVAAARDAPSSWWQRLHGLASEVSVIGERSEKAAVAPPPNGGINEETDEEINDETASKTQPSTTFTMPELPGFIGSAAQEVKPPTPPDSLSARIGKAMHRLLEWSDLSDLAARQAAQEFGLETAEASHAQAMATAIRHGAAAWVWDESVLAWQGNEVELIHQGQTLRLDRLVQRKDVGHENHWWVLDYKSAPDPQRQADLVDKMHSYVDALRGIYPGQTIKAAFLTADGSVLPVG